MSIGEILLRSRYQPLERVLSYDVFNTGFNGWMTLMPNFTEYPDFDVPKTLVNKDQWPPVMLVPLLSGIRVLTELCPALTLLNFRQDLLPLLIRRFRRKVVWDMPLSGFRSLVRAANICR